jgi:cystathionine gamma-synthase
MTNTIINASALVITPAAPAPAATAPASSAAPPPLSRKLVYSRPDNPSYVQVESVLATLDGGAGAALFASGMAAASAMATALLRVGDRMVCPSYSYFAIRVFFREYCDRGGIEFALFDSSVKGSLEAAIGTDGRTKLVWVETPANPSWTVTDIAHAATAAHAQNAVLCVDATVLTPLLCRPIDFGADFVMHSATKYLNGHSDVIAGAIVAAVESDAWEAVKRARAIGGAVLGAFEAWLLLRGMRTLHIRIKRQSDSALTLAARLHAHPRITHVLYPGLITHPMHAVSVAQQSGSQAAGTMFGGMLSIRVAGGAEAALHLLSRLKIWAPATSLGGVESLIEHRATVEGPDSGVPGDLLRLSVGLEDAEDLFQDLSRALDGRKRHSNNDKPESKKRKAEQAEQHATTVASGATSLLGGGDGGVEGSLLMDNASPDGNKRRCKRGCMGLVCLTDRSTHSRVQAKHYCARSDGPFPAWVRAGFPGEDDAWVARKVDERSELKWGEGLPQVEGLPPLSYPTLTAESDGGGGGAGGGVFAGVFAGAGKDSETTVNEGDGGGQGEGGAGSAGR